MIAKKHDLFITEISEEDFRKLDLVGYVRIWDVGLGGYKKLTWREVKLNEELDKNIDYWIKQGYESDLEDLKCPVTVAIHINNGPNPEDFYYDKYLNRYKGATTYHIAIGIPHLYSTRDYFEMKGDYWKVLKRETKAIYRIHLNERHLKRFKLKHKTKKVPWPYSYDEIPVDCKKVELQIHYDLDEKTGEWVESSRCKVLYYEHSQHIIPVDENGKEKQRDYRNENGLSSEIGDGEKPIKA